MTKVKQYDKIRLKSGFIGRIMEVLGADEAFIVDVADDKGFINTADVKPDDISSVFVETEQPYTPIRHTA